MALVRYYIEDGGNITMINFLKKHNKKIEFVLLFLPLFLIYMYLLNVWDARDRFEIFQYLSTGLDDRRLVIGYELMDLITWFMPFIMWKVISKYWLK